MSRTIQLDMSPLTASNVDEENAIITGVSVITAGEARGHGLVVDDTTIAQLFQCATSCGSVPVKIDHSSGASGICGYLTSFYTEGNRLRASWHLLHSHPQTATILEVARRMPDGVGLSVSFVAPDGATGGLARCEELISVDYVTRPAANAGLFSRPDQSRLVVRTDFSAQVVHYMQSKAGLRRIEEVTARHIDGPDLPQGATTAIAVAKKPWARRIAKKAAVVTAGGTAGFLVGRRWGGRAGAAVGAIGALMLEEKHINTTVSLSLKHVRSATNL
jgi:hypothetical protein